MNLFNLKTTSITVERDIAATPEAIFDAWLDRDSRGSPWHGVAAILQPVLDGLFYRMHNAAQGDYELAHYGRFVALERPRLMRYTWVSQHTRGLESVVTMTMEPRDTGTRVVIRHEGLPDDDKGRMHEAGWSHCLAELHAAMTEEATQ